MSKTPTYISLASLISLLLFITVYERYTMGEAQNTVAQAARVLELPLWNLDDDLSTVYGRLISRAEGYRHIQIYHPNNDLFIEVPGLLTENSVDHGLTWMGLIRDIPISSPIVHMGEQIGRVDTMWVNYNVYTYVIVCLFLISFSIISQYYIRLVQSRQTLAQNIDALNIQIAERTKVETALADEKERLSVTLRSIGDGVITTDTECRIILMNPVAETLTGWLLQEAQGEAIEKVFNIIHEKTRQPQANPIIHTIKTHEIVTFSSSLLLARNGEERIVTISSAPIQDRRGRLFGSVLVFQDITDDRKSEEERIKISKLESISLLAGGIAHDFNNNLTAVLGFVNLARLQSQAHSTLDDYLAQAEEAVKYAKNLTARLLTFSRGGAPIKSLHSVKELVEDANSLVLSGSNVRAELSMPDDLWHAEVDRDQIIQVVQNLVINSDQAMPDGGIIHITGENVTFDTAQNVWGFHLDIGFYIKLTVKDQGLGIPSDHLQKIFDPYFTTKSAGTGLGLTTAYTIIQKHDGAIGVESATDQGTKIELYLPASSGQGKVNTNKPAEAKVLPEEGGRILVMDDEPLIRALFDQVLTKSGYSVTCVPDGEDLIDLYSQALDSNKPYDAVILDLTIPGGVGGKETINRLQKIDPDVKAVVSSGYSHDPVLAEYEKHGFRGMVEKPFRPSELVRVLQKVIDDTSS